jgi:hypothetical protein
MTLAENAAGIVFHKNAADRATPVAVAFGRPLEGSRHVGLVVQILLHVRASRLSRGPGMSADPQASCWRGDFVILGPIDVRSAIP